MNVLHGRTALVTGASSGLGVDFATLLAERGCHLILVARREDRLRTLADELAAKHGVRVEVIAMSLSPLGAAQELYDRIRARNLTVDVLINNAGFGVYGPFTQIPWEREEEMLRLDVIALVHLTKLFVRDMVARNLGWIMQVSSIGALPTLADLRDLLRRQGVRAELRRGAQLRAARHQREGVGAVAGRHRDGVPRGRRTGAHALPADVDDAEPPGGRDRHRRDGARQAEQGGGRDERVRHVEPALHAAPVAGGDGERRDADGAAAGGRRIVNERTA